MEFALRTNLAMEEVEVQAPVLAQERVRVAARGQEQVVVLVGALEQGPALVQAEVRVLAAARALEGARGLVLSHCKGICNTNSLD